MKIEIRADSVTIEGYVNAVERPSKPLLSRFGEFIEKICAGAFGRALERNKDVRIFLNHDPKRDLGGTGTGELELEEDNIGLHARATITDPEVIKDARNGDLVGWSFGFEDRAVDITQDGETGLPFRMVKDLNLYEVSLLNREKTPAYNGTLVNVRSDEDGKTINLGESVEPETIDVIDETAKEIVEEIKTELRAEAETVTPEAETPAEAKEDIKSYDNSRYKNIIAELKTMRDSVKN
ncbi:MAG: HK97 family phage prohead protease [Clostridia bacterium]|nr:HK97 family phage prohead protease [Clostridia bacterium]